MQPTSIAEPKFNQVEADVDLGVLADDPLIQAEILKLLGTIRHGSQGFSGRLRIVALPEETQKPQLARKAPIAGSPGDWYANEDQMTVGAVDGAQELVW